MPLAVSDDSDQFKYSEFMKFMQNVGDGEVGLENGAVGGTTEDWVKEFNTSKKTEGSHFPYSLLIHSLTYVLTAETTDNYNTQFWNRLQDEWKKMSSEDSGHPWLSEFTDYYEPYKVFEISDFIFLKMLTVNVPFRNTFSTKKIL